MLAAGGAVGSYNTIINRNITINQRFLRDRKRRAARRARQAAYQRRLKFYGAVILLLLTIGALSVVVHKGEHPELVKAMVGFLQFWVFLFVLAMLFSKLY